VSKMLGREITAPTHVQAGAAVSGVGGTPVLSARNLSRTGSLHPLDLDLRAGEVLGLAGLLGSGRTETARLLFGLDRRDTGELCMKGAPVRINSPRDAIALGLALCSEDRKTEGILPNLSVRKNLIIALQARRGALRPLSLAEQDRLCAYYIRTLGIRTPDAETPVKNLSGGNQQKVLLARWLATRPALIILDEPTRGIDIGAKAEIEQLIADLRADGLAVLFISSELDEVVRNSTRVVVLRERRHVGEFHGDAITGPHLMQAMAGGHQPHE